MANKFNVVNPKGKASTAKSRSGANPVAGRSHNDSMVGKAGAGKQTTTASYAGKGATTTGFVTSRARELGSFKK